MAKQPKSKNVDGISKKEDISSTSSSNNNSPLYGEYYNKNTLYIYKDNSTTRVTYDNKNSEYIERKYI